MNLRLPVSEHLQTIERMWGTIPQTPLADELRTVAYIVADHPGKGVCWALGAMCRDRGLGLHHATELKVTFDELFRPVRPHPRIMDYWLDIGVDPTQLRIEVLGDWASGDRVRIAERHAMIQHLHSWGMIKPDMGRHRDVGIMYRLPYPRLIR